MNLTYLLIGGNVGDRPGNMKKAAGLIGDKVGKIIKSSSLYETAAWGNQDQPPFLNQVLQVETTKTASQVLSDILGIEHDMGRERTRKFGPRTIDIDILFFNSEIMQEAGLTIPHDQLHLRRFTLEPLNEIAPNYIHPVFNKSIADLLMDCPDPLSVKKL